MITVKQYLTWLAVIVFLTLAFIYDAKAAEHSYKATWNDNPPEDEVNKYEVVGTSSTGKVWTTEVTGNPPISEATLLIDEPTGTSISFTVQAFNATAESALSDPVVVVHPSPIPSIPTGVQVIQVDVTVKVTQ